jgi:hypothetical protein
MSKKAIQPAIPCRAVLSLMPSLTFNEPRPSPSNRKKLSKNAQRKMILTPRCAHVRSEEPPVPCAVWPSPAIKTGSPPLSWCQPETDISKKGLSNIPVGGAYRLDIVGILGILSCQGRPVLMVVSVVTFPEGSLARCALDSQPTVNL